MTEAAIKRGDVVLVDFGQAGPHEASFVRPAVVVTNDNANRYSPVLVVLPLTSNTHDVLAFQVFLPRSATGLDRDSKVQVELIRSVGRSRIMRTLGMVPADLMSQIDRRLSEHLDLTLTA